jgi:hypothetical protein
MHVGVLAMGAELAGMLDEIADYGRRSADRARIDSASER